MARTFHVVWVLVVGVFVGTSAADVRNMGGTRNADGSWTGLASLETVCVGNPGNAADTRYATPGYGSVGYTYNIGKYEVTAGQYCEFLNAVAKTDTYGLYSPSMWNNQVGCKIQRSGISGSYTYSVASDYANRPVNFVSWGNAARYCNWITNGQPVGEQNQGTTENGSYLLNGLTDKQAILAVNRKVNARYVIPNENEWYKAAYHKNDGITGHYWSYPTGTDTMPIAEVPPGTNISANFNMVVGHTTDVGAYSNAAGPYGTFDQGGNCWEWNESVPYGSSRGIRGGSIWGNYYLLHASHRDCIASQYESGYDIGFRVVEVPPPPVVMSFSINNDTLSTISRSVLLNNICSNWPTEYMASESSDFAGATWQSYSTEPTFVLSSGTGTKTVYFKVKNAIGESATVSDTITLILTPTGFVWNRSADWVVRPASDNGTSIGNPSSDALGNAVWRYEYVVGGEPLGTATPWYVQPSSIMVWDNVWFGTNASLWAHGDNRNPCIAQSALTHNLTNSGNSLFTEVPLVRWINPASEPFYLVISGNMKVTWTGWNGASTDVTVDVVLGMNDASTNTTSLLYSTTVNRPPSYAIDLPINIPPLQIEPGDQLFVSFRGRTAVADRWLGLYDDITFTVVAITSAPTITSFSINNNALSTPSCRALLNNSCSDWPMEYIASESPDFAGATWQSYSTTPVFTLSSGAGTKTVYFKVRNPLGESPAISDTITLVGCEITQHPLSQTICPTGMVQFAVSASGYGSLAYQWQKEGVNLGDGGHYSGVNSATLIVSNADSSDTGDYRCVVTNEVNSVISNQANLSLKPATSITQQPTPQTVTRGGDAQFRITASGSGTLTYQWQKDGVNLGDNSRIIGTTTETLTIIGTDCPDYGQYLCVVTASCGTVYSNPATLVATSISQQPTNQWVSRGGNAQFSIAATGSGSLTHQWRKNGTNLSDDSRISGSSASTLTITGVECLDYGSYDCIVNANCGSVTSNTALLCLSSPSLNSVVVIYEDNFDSYANQAEFETQWTKDGNPVYFLDTSFGLGGKSVQMPPTTVSLDGNSDRWYHNLDCTYYGSDSEPLVFSYDLYLDPAGASTSWSGAWHSADIRGYSGGGYKQGNFMDLIAIGVSPRAPVPNTSWFQGRIFNNVDLGYLNLNNIITLPDNTTTNPPQRSSGWHHLEAIVTSQQIKYLVDGQMSAIANRLGTGINVVQVGAGISANGHTMWADNIKLAITPILTAITQQPANQAICTNGTAYFTVAATGEGNLTYQWKYNGTPLSNGGKYTGVTTSALQITSVTRSQIGSYHCVVSNSLTGEQFASTAATLRFKTFQSVAQHPTPTIVSAGTTATFTVICIGEGSLSYQWQKNNIILSNGGHYSGVTTPTLTVAHADSNDAASYRCVITGGCGSATSNTATLTVNYPSCNTPKMDANGDLHVDSVDFDAFSACYNGPTNLISGNCYCLDANNDHYVDAIDFDVFSACYNGPVNPPGC